MDLLRLSTDGGLLLAEGRAEDLILAGKLVLIRIWNDDIPQDGSLRLLTALAEVIVDKMVLPLLSIG